MTDFFVAPGRSHRRLDHKSIVYARVVLGAGVKHIAAWHRCSATAVSKIIKRHAPGHLRPRRSTKAGQG